MTIIDTNLLKEAIYNLCKQAGQDISKYTYETIYNGYKKTNSIRLAHILQNAKNANKIQRPLCQDTGSVHVFMEVGNEISFSSNPTEAINAGVEKCYIEKYFRKSTVENTFISGTNKENNTPAIIHTEFASGNDIKIKVLLKGAGCDNVSTIQMLLPTITKDELAEFCAKEILEKGKNACPPVFVSIAIGGGAENVMSIAEKAYFTGQNDIPELTDKIKKIIKENENEKYEGFYTADIFLTAKPHHMASLPVAIAFNCHSLRIAEAEISEKGIIYTERNLNYQEIKEKTSAIKEIHTEDIDSIRNLKEGENILLSGDILIARDAAHKKMTQLKENGEKIPFETKNKIIFYAAPCPAAPGEITGPIGPTTAHRMDKFLDKFPEVLATMGKGPRSQEAEDIIRKNQSVYFEIEGGIATLLASRFTQCEIIAFKELSTEAVYYAKISKLPAKVAISKNK